ncbi:dihydrolipoamide acetyltransferase family protein [Nocardia carnea]|uniref:dihydrolipoamide acetyltransferase family protein n=1 Tax=Nocardia carnea TaxID=37328 RepID=UPI002454AA81|nr:dihydrolipoamide acetyltransferase family protein [Nocardia carnea]
MSSTAHTVVLPALGEAVTEATITRWLKNVGDHVDENEPLLEVATDKVDTEIVSPATGILSKILYDEDSTVAVGDTIATLTETAPAHPKSISSSAPGTTVQIPDDVELASPRDPEPPGATHELPLAPAGTAVAGAPTRTRTEKLSRVRRTIAARMLASLHTSAQLTTVIEADLTEVAALRAQTKDEFYAGTGHKLTFLPFVTMAAVQALAEHPVINSALDAECTTVTYHDSVHLGIAVDSPKGLMVPVVRDAHRLTLAGLTAAISQSADAVRTGTITPDALTGGTFTITNTGSRGALFDTPILNQPQSAILGVGSIVERLVPERDTDGNLLIRVRSMAYLALSYDHRIIDGADAARYLVSVRTRLEDPRGAGSDGRCWSGA